MASVRECEKLRGAAEVKLNSEIRKLRKACEVVSPNVRLVANLVAGLDTAFDFLIDNHVALVMKMNAQLSEPRFAQYMTKLEDAVDAVKAPALVITQSADGDGVPIMQVDVEKLKKDLAMMDLSMDTQLTGLKAAVATNLTKEQYEEVAAGVRELADLLYVRFREVCTSLVKASPAEAVRLEEEHTTIFNQKIPEVEKLKVDLRVKKPPEVVVTARHQAPRGAVEGVAVQGYKQTVKMKPLDHPEFDGKAKNYTRFKQRFEEMINPNFDTMGQLEFLEKAIPKWVKERMSLIRKTPEQLWEQLDEMFADPKVMLREAMDELHSLDHRKLGDSFIHKFAATLVDTEVLLDANQNGDYLRHPREVAHIQDKLPRAEKLEYIRREKGYHGSDFAKLKAFLLERKQEEEELRKFGTGVKEEDPKQTKKKCDYCTRTGHTKEECFKYKREQAGGETKSGSEKSERGCWNCGDAGHKSFGCPQPKQSGKAGKGGKTSSSQDIQSNHLRTADCPRCKSAAGLPGSCAGCGKAGQNLKHCLAHCSTYLGENVAGKAGMVIKAKGCVICLHPNHTADQCYDKDNQKRICGLDNCKSHHHPTLHGAKDPQVATCNVTRVLSGSFGSWGEKFVKEKLARCYSIRAASEAVRDEEEFQRDWQNQRREAELAEIMKKLGEKLLDGDSVLLIIQEIIMITGTGRVQRTVITFFDPGSTCSLILTEFAERHGLEGTPVTITIGTVNGEKERATKLYMVELLTTQGERKLVRAFGMEGISERIPYICFHGVKHLFSKAVQDEWKKVTSRPVGAIELLVGAEVASYLPEKLETQGELVVMKSAFGSGYAVFGSHPEIKAERVKFCEDVKMIRQKGIKVTTQYSNRVSVSYNMADKFMEAEGLGVEPPRRCPDCRGCPKCSFRGQQHTERETLEYKTIEQGIRHNKEKGHFEVQYAWLDDPAKLSDNSGQAIRIAESEEKKLAKEGLTEEFNQKFDEFIKLGTLEELSQHEMDSWEGPSHYVSIQHVVKPQNKTTRMRLVINSSLKCPKTGLSLNDLMMKGPNVLGDIWELLMRFRGYRFGLISDISKAYHSLKTGLLEKHLRKVVWRHGRQGTVWRVYAFLVVAFGDRIAAVLLQIAIRITNEMYKTVDLVASHKLLYDMFVDDLISGGELLEVLRFMGNRDIDTGKCDGTMVQIMEKGGLFFKAMQMSGELDEEQLELLGGAVLGIGWSSERDRFIFKISINVSQRKRKQPTGEDVTKNTIYLLEGATLSKRICLSVVNSIFDPIGMLTPLTIILKVMLKRMFSKEYNLSWDDGLPKELHKQWVEVLQMLVGVELEFDRSIMPITAVGRAILAAFWDGSDEAFAAVIYAIWLAMETEVPMEVRLVASKARVAADWEKNTVRQEMNGAVLMTRLLVKVVRALDIKPQRVWAAGDSETVLASREKHSGYFSEYYGNRVGETHDNQKKIEEFCPVGESGEWWHIKGSDNPADRPTRLDTKPDDIMYGSTWQRGEDFLKLPRCQWPLERNFAGDGKDKVTIPRTEVNRKYRDMVEIGVHSNSVRITELEEVVLRVEGAAVECMATRVVAENMMGPEHPDNPIVKKFLGGHITNDWQVLLKRTMVYFQWLAKVVRGRTGDQTVSAYHMAMLFWIKQAMPATRQAFKDKKLEKLTLWEKDGMLVVSGRAMEGLKHYFGVDHLPVLMSSSRVAEIVMLDAHNSDHGGRDTTLVTATQVVWIVGGRRLAGKVVMLCVRCRYLRKKLEGQKMAPLPPSLAVPAPPFTNVGLDLFGPLIVKKMGGAKSTRGVQGTFKVWGVLILCLNTKAVKLYIAAGYSTADFLMSFEQFTSDHGRPATVHSDRGSNLVCAAKEVDSPDYDWDIIEKSSGGKTRWIFCPSGCQFRNGAAESFVKKTKRTLAHTYGGKSLTFHELETALKRAASILNSRPMSAICCRKGGVDPDFITALTPNMMLLGRANCDAPLKNYEDSETPLARLQYIAEIESLFWHQFKVQDFHSLVPTQKWRVEKRNMRQGDVVLILYSGKSKSAEYKLGRIVAVEVDPDKLVRTCLVRYSLVQNMPKEDRLNYKGVTIKHIRVAIQRLVVILAQEEQKNIRTITEEETRAAFAEVATEEGDQEHRVLKSVANPVKDNLVCNMLKARYEFENLAESWLVEKESQIEQSMVTNTIMSHEGRGMICGMCELCREDFTSN